MKRYAVIGNPLGHSLSPAMHNAAFKKLGADAKYEAVELKKLDQKAFDCLKRTYAGINVTIPYKVDILDYVDDREVAVDLIGAANCIKFGKEVKAYNTDYIGAVEALKTQVPKLKNKRILVLGAGGAARAVVYGCILEGAEVTVYNRTLKKARELAGEIDKKLAKDITVAKEIDLDGFNILVNATSVGMAPEVNKTPLTSPIPSNAGHNLVVMDIVYNPLETKLLKQAKMAGAKTVDGTEMFIRQGAESLRIWGYKPKLDVMRNAVLQELGKTK